MDGWALCKRHTHGTVLVDLDRRRPVALLPGREADTLATRLREHPGAEAIPRDRAETRSVCGWAGAHAIAQRCHGVMSAELTGGARNRAPEAVQVAGRFHLLQNPAETLEVVFTEVDPLW